MIRFLFVLLTFLLVAGPVSAHGMGETGHANGTVVQSLNDPSSPPVLPPGHRHNDPTSLHCSVSVSCAPLFTFADPGLVMAPAHALRSWSMAREELLRASAPERDPPVPRA